jgi:hypothetical protein
LPILKTDDNSISHVARHNAFHLPWDSQATWMQAHQSVDFHLHRYADELIKPLWMAQTVKDQFIILFPILDDLCFNSCTWCPETCCQRARVWFDFKDLLFLHFNRLAIPPAQPMTALNTNCRYYSHKGCLLPRIARPWICIWYLCPVQTAILRKRDSLQYDAVNRIIQEIKSLRKEMEDVFIRVVT